MRRKACAATVKVRVTRDNAKKGMGEEKTKGHEGRARGRGVAPNTHLPGDRSVGVAPQEHGGLGMTRAGGRVATPGYGVWDSVSVRLFVGSDPRRLPAVTLRRG